MESIEVQVGLLPAFEAVFDVKDGSARIGSAWGDLKHVTIATDPEDTFRDVMRKACDSLGVTLTSMAREAEASIQKFNGQEVHDVHAADKLVFAAFRCADDDVVVHGGEFPVLKRDQRIASTEFIVRNEEGLIVWRRPGLDASMAELIDASSHGLIEGDPEMAYLNPTIPQGDFGSLGEWRSFIQALEILWDVVSVASVVGGATALTEQARRLLKQRSQETPEVVRHHSKAWSERGASPGDLFRFLISKPRSSEEIAALVGCSDSEAQALLWGLGFVLEESSSLWIYRGDPLAQFLGDSIDFSFADIFNGEEGQARFRDFVERRVGSYVSSGESPSKEDTEADIDERRRSVYERSTDCDILDFDPLLPDEEPNRSWFRRLWPGK